ncbi:MAG: hypothetical protein HY782_08680 [Chloroflexi bacterium]|nr:hypothetical protein [Chloroflexota bacterium]
METYRIETIVSANRVLTIRGVPFRPGATVEVIILSHRRREDRGARYPLRGKPVRYTRPFDSVGEDEKSGSTKP